MSQVDLEALETAVREEVAGLGLRSGILALLEEVRAGRGALRAIADLWEGPLDSQTALDNARDIAMRALASPAVPQPQEAQEAQEAGPSPAPRSEPLTHDKDCGYLTNDPMTGDEGALCSCGAVEVAHSRWLAAGPPPAPPVLGAAPLTEQVIRDVERAEDEWLARENARKFPNGWAAAPEKAALKEGASRPEEEEHGTEAEHRQDRALPEPRQPERTAQVGAEGGDHHGSASEGGGSLRGPGGSLRAEPDGGVLRPGDAVQRDAEGRALELAPARVATSGGSPQGDPRGAPPAPPAAPAPGDADRDAAWRLCEPLFKPLSHAGPMCHCAFIAAELARVRSEERERWLKPRDLTPSRFNDESKVAITEEELELFIRQAFRFIPGGVGSATDRAYQALLLGWLDARREAIRARASDATSAGGGDR